MTTIRNLGPDDLDRFLEVRSVSFPPWEIDDRLYRDLMADRLQHSRGLFVADELACVATMFPTTMYFAGTSVPMGALAGVASAPQHRRRGHIRTLLLDGLRRLHEQGVGWCLEYPFDPRFYHRLGWQSLPVIVDLEIPSNYLFAGKPPAADRVPLTEFAALASIYDAWARRYNFCLTRVDDPRDAWNRLVSDWWLDDPGFLYRLEGAYLLFALSREEGKTVMSVEDYAYDSAQGRTNLFAFIGSLHGQVDTVRISLPADEPVALDHRTRHSASHWPVQARVVDLAAALGPLRSDSETVFTIRVRDEWCSWNDGVFRVATGPEGTAVTAGEDANVQVELPVQTLPLLLAGLLPARAAVEQGLASGSPEALVELARLGGGRTPFMPRSDAF